MQLFLLIICYFFWPAAVALMARAQSRLLPALRQLPPAAPEALAANSGLHTWLSWVYYWPLSLAPWVPVPGWQWVVLAGVARLAFDPLENLFEHRPVLAVGFTAWTDRTIRRLSPANPELFALWVRMGLAAGGISSLFIW